MNRTRFGYARFGFFLFLGVTLSPVVSAALPSSVLPGVVDRPPIELPPVLSEDRVEVPVSRPQPLAPPAEEGAPVATLTRIDFGGTLVLKESALQKVVMPYLNRPITGGDIAQMKYELTSLYFKDGYVLVKVTTPPQDLSDGIMKVVVIAGRIGTITTNNDVLNERIANSRTRAIHSGDVFNERTVESALQDVDDLTNIEASVSLRPGEKTGTTDLDIQIQKALQSQDIQVFTVDNYGSKFTGETVGRLTLQKSNLMGLGETLAITGRKSEDDFWSAQTSAIIPLPLRNLKLEMDYLRSDNSIGDVFTVLDSDGESEVYQLAVSSALINQRQQKLVLRGGVERGRYESFLDNVKSTDDTISKLYAEGSYTMRNSRLVSFLSLRASKGISGFGADDKGELDSTRIKGDPRAWTFDSLLYTNIRLTDKDFAQLVVQGQYSSATLLSSDLFVIGGYGSVRGYEPAQSTGDSGASATLDVYHQFNMPDRWYAQAGPFVDYGYVHNRVDHSTLENNLWSAGIGVEFNYKHSSRFTSKLRLDWAHPLSHKSLPHVDDDTLYARFTQLF